MHSALSRIFHKMVFYSRATSCVTAVWSSSFFEETSVMGVETPKNVTAVNQDIVRLIIYRPIRQLNGGTGSHCTLCIAILFK